MFNFIAVDDDGLYYYNITVELLADSRYTKHTDIHDNIHIVFISICFSLAVTMNTTILII